MNTLTEFKETIEGNYGILDIPTYNEYKKNRSGENGGVPVGEIELMSPDNPSFNSSSFWEYIEKNPKLAKDAICFGAQEDTPIEVVNARNFTLATTQNALTYVIGFKDYVDLPMLDIGPGYGMLRDFVKQNTKLKYHSADVYPKIEGCFKVGDDGYTLPEELMAMKFGLVVSTNVFQHLSVNQRRKYYEQIEKILMPGGVFTVNMSVLIPNTPNHAFKGQDGKLYMCHYGQYTEVQYLQEVVNDLAKHFSISSMAYRCEAVPVSYTFHCTTKPQMPPTTTEQPNKA